MSDDQLGATGTYSQGKLNEDDEGDLMVKISLEGDNVRIDFGKPVAWLALDADAALAIGSGMIEHGMRLKFRGAHLMAEALGETKQ
jgi:hypothetical protein